MNRFEKMNNFKYILLLAAVIFFVSTAVGRTDVPGILKYQGTLTDTLGDPILDDTYFIRFIIWNDSLSTDPANELWNSNIQTYLVLGGLLESNLGEPPTPAISSDIFSGTGSLFLGITVGTEPELKPRIKLASAPFAFKSALSDTATVALSVPLNSISLSSLTQSSAESGQVIKWSGSAWVAAPDESGVGNIASIIAGSGLTGGGNSGDVSLSIAAFGVTTGHIQPRAVGTQQIAANAVTAFEIAANSIGLSEMDNNAVGGPQIIDNSIFGIDIVDEPGIAQGQPFTIIPLSTSTMTDLTTVSLVTPAPGFVFVQGRATISLDSTTGSNYAFMQITVNTTGDTVSGIYSKVGASNYSASGQYSFNCTAQRTFLFTTAGPQTIRLEAKYTASSGSAEASAAFPILTAFFFPTSYGTVTPVADNPGDKPQSSNTTNGNSRGADE